MELRQGLSTLDDEHGLNLLGNVSVRCRCPMNKTASPAGCSVFAKTNFGSQMLSRDG